MLIYLLYTWSICSESTWLFLNKCSIVGYCCWVELRDYYSPAAAVTGFLFFGILVTVLCFSVSGMLLFSYAFWSFWSDPTVVSGSVSYWYLLILSNASLFLFYISFIVFCTSYLVDMVYSLCDDLQYWRLMIIVCSV